VLNFLPLKGGGQEGVKCARIPLSPGRHPSQQVWIATPPVPELGLPDAPPSEDAGRERRALLAALAAVALWSSVATGFKLGLEVLEPVQLLFAGCLVSTCVFVVRAGMSPGWRTARPSLAAAALFGIANPFVYYLVLFEAYDRLPAQIAQPLNYTWAITLALLAVPVLGQRLARRTLIGIVVSYAGVVVLLSRGRITALPEIDWLGVALALASTIVWAGYWLAQARSRSDPAALMALSFAIALPLIGLACWAGPGLPPLTWRTALFGGWIGLVEMGVTFLVWQRALALTRSAARIGQLIFLSPFASLVLIWAVLGETIHPATIAGLAIIVAGLAVAGRPGAT